MGNSQPSTVHDLSCSFKKDYDKSVLELDYLKNLKTSLENQIQQLEENQRLLQEEYQNCRNYATQMEAVSNYYISTFSDSSSSSLQDIIKNQQYRIDFLSARNDILSNELAQLRYKLHNFCFCKISS